ncbi:two-component response regulator [Dehalogenimonas sp. WBC-2]|nr:two-component response regulator [Dehalogenimonas sp. WBC-2]
MKILVIEDDQQLCQDMRQALTENGHVTECVFNGADGEHAARYSDFDLVILDLMLPDKSGIEVCRSLRAVGVNTPILMLTSRRGLEDKVEGLNSGADDYLCKPFEYKELFARIQALHRRQLGNRSPVITISGITVDTVAHEIKRGNIAVKLTAAEYRILELFITNPNTLLTRSTIEDHIWGAEHDCNSNVVDSHITKLRQKLGWDSQTGPIQTVRGCGYRLNR